MPKIPWLTLCMVFHAQSLSFSSLFLQNSDIVRQNITRKLCAGGGHSAHHACATPIPDFNRSVDKGFPWCAAFFWLLVASLVGAWICRWCSAPITSALVLILPTSERMTGWVKSLVLIQQSTGLELRSLGSQATTLIARPTPGNFKG